VRGMMVLHDMLVCPVAEWRIGTELAVADLYLNKSQGDTLKYPLSLTLNMIGLARVTALLHMPSHQVPVELHPQEHH
jgi:hypothetical protein